MSYTLPEPYLTLQGKSRGKLTGQEMVLFEAAQMQSAYEAGRASRDAEVDKLKLKAELLKVALETSEGYLKQEREEVEALEKFRNEVINATGNKALADWIEKHGRPVPMQQEIDSLQAEVEALRADAERYRHLRSQFRTEWLHNGVDYGRGREIVSSYARVGVELPRTFARIGHSNSYKVSAETIDKAIDAATKEK